MISFIDNQLKMDSKHKVRKKYNELIRHLKNTDIRSKGKKRKKHELYKIK